MQIILAKLSIIMQNVIMETIYETYIADASGERADAGVARITGKTRAKIEELIEQKCVLINDKHIKKSLKLCEGDVIKVHFKPEPMPDLTAKDIPLEVVKEFENYAIINKPAGLTVHPAPGNYDETLVNALLYKFAIDDEDNGFRPGIVHRLDKDTSGLMMIAKNADSRNQLAELFSSRKIIKKYTAICYGVPRFHTKTIENYIGRDKHNRQRMCLTDEDNGRYAKSEFKVIETFKSAFLAEVTIFTGRTHQIRVHAASIGHSLIGDSVYGNKILHGFERQALHSSYLSFTDPFTNEHVEVTSQMPADMLDLVSKLKNK